MPVIVVTHNWKLFLLKVRVREYMYKTFIFSVYNVCFLSQVSYQRHFFLVQYRCTDADDTGKVKNSC